MPPENNRMRRAAACREASHRIIEKVQTRMDSGMRPGVLTVAFKQAQRKPSADGATRSSAVEGFSRQQTGFEEIAFDATAVALGDLVLGKSGQDARCRPTWTITAIAALIAFVTVKLLFAVRVEFPSDTFKHLRPVPLDSLYVCRHLSCQDGCRSQSKWRRRVTRTRHARRRPL